MKVVIGTDEGKVLCVSNDEDVIKKSMVDYLAEFHEEKPPEDFYELRNWGEWDIEVYDYESPRLTLDQEQEKVEDSISDCFKTCDCWQELNVTLIQLQDFTDRVASEISTERGWD